MSYSSIMLHPLQLTKALFLLFWSTSLSSFPGALKSFNLTYARQVAHYFLWGLKKQESAHSTHLC